MTDYRRLTAAQIEELTPVLPGLLVDSYLAGMNFDFLGMRVNGNFAGVAVLRPEPEEVQLCYLYVAENLRNRGYGGNFLSHIIYQAYKAGKKIFRVHMIPGENPEFERLLSTYEFLDSVEEAGEAEVPLKLFEELECMKWASTNVLALAQCPENGLWALYRRMEKTGDNLISMPLELKDYDTDCSAVMMEDGKPAGLLLVQKMKDGKIAVLFMINLSENVTAPIQMMRFAIQQGSRRYPPETLCTFAITNESLMRFLEKLGVSPIRKRVCRRLSLDSIRTFEQEEEYKKFLYLLDEE